ncbi:bolA-like protein 3 [Lineus longissimus]|uniref:bolA-like protein 3 n=1 Tax=Lineus longissimus TaxID=88925 RepID=UPI00315CC069
MFKSVISKLRPALAVSRRFYCDAPARLTQGEQKLSQLLKTKFPMATAIQVQDISGGCGAMFEVLIESPEFEGKRTVMQHRMVNEALKEEIKDMHGIRITTNVPKS